MYVLSDEAHECIDACMQCSDSCTDTLRHCLDLGGKHAERTHIALLKICAETCGLTAKAIVLGSTVQAELMDACQKISLACAEDCESMGEDAEMQKCAEFCRQCAHACEKHSSHESVKRIA